MNQRARDILMSNDLGGYTVPNKNVYPFQWNWDSAFVALGFAEFDIDRAWKEIETLFDAQWQDGFVPQIVFWQENDGYFPGASVWQTGKTPATSGITQPPVAASMVRQIWEMDKSDKNRAHIEHLFPKIMAWHRWFDKYRDPLNKGLVVATHPWETGRDNAPEWDEPAAAVDISAIGPYERRDTLHLDKKMRPHKEDYDRFVAMVEYGRAQNWDHKTIATEGPFRVVDVGMTMMLIRANKDMLALANEFDFEKDAVEIGNWIHRAQKGVDFLWNDKIGAFCSKDLISGRSSGIISSATFLCFYAGVGSDMQRASVSRNLEKIATTTRFLMPSLLPDNPRFDAMRYWRGPVWAVVNYMISKGCREVGLVDLSERIKLDTAALMKQSGFYEAFNPETGEGTGGEDFSWTAAMWLHWAGK
ncbi:MAG: hypothetical protein COB49_10405 [Alphaproteobacteria bacterium]|nr:MAG: hypothetical protein COB49_10405 [Alphaproteobacteria bacterium]